MPRFNRKLSQLEAIYKIAKPVLVSESPDVIYSHLIESFESPDSLKGWFDNVCIINRLKAESYVQHILENSGKLVNRKSILEGIEYYRNKNE